MRTAVAFLLLASCLPATEPTGADDAGTARLRAPDGGREGEGEGEGDPSCPVCTTETAAAACGHAALCVDGFCLPSCTVGQTCPADRACEPLASGPCTVSADCPADVCRDGACALNPDAVCVVDADCGEPVCADGGCVSALACVPVLPATCG